MKKTWIFFIAACLLLCLIPSVGMLFFPTTKSSENKPMAEAPRLLTEEGKVNTAVFSQFETWFNQRIALRNQLLYADAVVQTNLFQESNVSGVIKGTDGWLYYTDTLDDYLGTDVMTDRELYNLANNFSLVEQYLQERSIDFLLTIAPNKNTLYGENMPYHKSVIANEDHSAVLLQPYLQAQNVNYLDLFGLFNQQEEVLYLKGDSHWNNKGAYLVFCSIMDEFALPYTQYDQPQPTENQNGDLNRMLYGFYGPAEQDYAYDLAGNYRYEKEGTSVEDGWIITGNAQGSGTLLMFRDSFANNLIPFFSEQFATAYYSKGEPNALEWYVESYTPDQVVIQKVERNIANYLNDPPVLTPPQTQLPDQIAIAETDTQIHLENATSDMRYYRISGAVDESRMAVDSQIVVRVGDTYYRAYQTGENGFALYLKKEAVEGEEVKLQVYLVNGDSCVQATSQMATIPNE